MSTVIQVSNLSKQYRLGQVGTGSLSHDINRLWHRAWGKEDPYLKIGEENNRETKGNSDYVWALKDINFDIEQGDRVGIIGRNGAGKSTLLKILSRTTSPTSGSVKIKGKVASLLEVGTGFHPDLSGRDNVFLNGAILGMSRKDIKSRFDEIVDFAGVERYIDTPVKRYSSGMYVRLAFAVAAYLESDILIVDEVLAVGDHEFQKRCLGKLSDVSNKEGRTVIFVSHNMDAVLRLCSHAIILNNGKINGYSNTNNIIDTYLKSDFGTTSLRRWTDDSAPGNQVVRLKEVVVHDEDYNRNETFNITKRVGITMTYEVLQEDVIFTHGINLYNSQGLNILNSHDIVSELRKFPRKKGVYSSTSWIPGNFLAEGTVVVGVAIFNHKPFHIHFHELDAVAFNVVDSFAGDAARGDYVEGFPGIVRPILNWETEKSN
ncbi:ABC transporter ATP-binding protein [Flavihumibacter sp. R14]|nr:ABC transporter ATP-binding protein [Flavihumibacter soli]